VNDQPAPAAKVGCAIIACVILGGLASFIWIGQMATLSDLTGSDAAGNSMSQAFAAIEIILLWLLMAIVLFIACVTSQPPLAAVLPGLLLIPLSGGAALKALELLSSPQSPPYLWPIVVSAVVPPLIALFCVWTLVPLARAVIPAWCAAGVVWSVTLLLSASIWPMAQLKQAAVTLQREQAEKSAADFAAVPGDAPLWDVTPFLVTRSDIQSETVLQRIRQSGRRQNDAETMLDRGDFPLAWLGQMDLRPTPSLCDKARALLRKQVETLVLKPGVSKPYATIRDQVAAAAAAMEWLAGYGCSCDAEAAAWETMANAYSNTEWDVHRLKDVRDPRELGRTLRESPAHFDMLTPQSHLKAWLHFAEDKSLHDQAMAGARKVEHRTADAVEMLNGTELDAWDVLAVLSELDLEATPDLCEAALRQVHRELSGIYRPKRDDPRPYSELLERMGNGHPLRALEWLHQHSCDTRTELGEAEELVGAYQDSPGWAAMLSRLGELH
jgi:hypothetical protein